jgi:hypothetical protein
MTIDALRHSEHQLDQCAGPFEPWRQSRAHPHERMPDPLWEPAMALAATLSPSRMAQHVRCRGSDLKEPSTKRQGSTAAQRPRPPDAPSLAGARPGAWPAPVVAAPLAASALSAAALRGPPPAAGLAADAAAGDALGLWPQSQVRSRGALSVASCRAHTP